MPVVMLALRALRPYKMLSDDADEQTIEFDRGTHEETVNINCAVLAPRPPASNNAKSSTTQIAPAATELRGASRKSNEFFVEKIVMMTYRQVIGRSK